MQKVEFKNDFKMIESYDSWTDLHSWALKKQNGGQKWNKIQTV